MYFPCIQASGWGLYREPLVIPTSSAETNTDYKEIDTNDRANRIHGAGRGVEKTGTLTDSLQPRKQEVRQPGEDREGNRHPLKAANIGQIIGWMGGEEEMREVDCFWKVLVWRHFLLAHQLEYAK